MSTKRSALQVAGALILAAFALFAVGCSTEMKAPLRVPEQGSTQSG
jgi:hypothetical protein